MYRIAQFEKISQEQWLKDIENIYPYTTYSPDLKIQIYNGIKLPVRATKGSAGYDINIPTTAWIKPKETRLIPTGIRVAIDPEWVLKIYPRSSLGFKYKFTLDNVVGIVDSDYYYSDNEGHIFLKMTNHGDKDVILGINDSIAQGIFVQYGITIDDIATTTRNGGFGSTNK